MIRVAICDDDSSQRETISAYIGQYAEEKEDTGIVFSAFFSPKQLLNAVTEYGGFDLYILDVLMPEMNGIELGLAIRKQDTDGKIIYLTSAPEFGVDSYLADAFFYLLKPVEKDKLFPIMERAIATVRNRKEKGIIVKSREQVQKLSFDDILYVELNRRAVVYSLINGEEIKSVTVRGSFAEAIEPLLHDDRFFICGASFAVNLYHVTSVEKDSVVFKKDRRLYMSKTQCAAVRSGWLDFWLKNGGKQ